MLAACTRSRRKNTVVSAATTSTTNITGFFISPRIELAKAEPIAGTMIFGSVSAVGVRLRSLELSMMSLRIAWSEESAGRHRQMFDDRARARARGRSEAADDEDHADEQADEQAASVGNVPGRGRHVFLAASEPAMASAGMIMKKRPISIATRQVVL